MTRYPTEQTKPKRSFLDHLINIVALLILAYFVVNEFSHLSRVPESIAAAPGKFQRHYTLSGTFPFVGSYFLMVPEGYDPKYQYPLVVALHGVSKRVYPAEALASDAFRKRYPVFVMVPVAPTRAFWATPENKAYQMKRNIPYPDHLPHVINGIYDIAQGYRIDGTRIFITGHSMGASGVIGALERYPEFFAAGIASSGAWDPAETQHLNDPLLILHGTRDPFVPYEQDKALAKALRARGLPVSFKSLKGQGHAIGPLVYSKPQVWDWLLSEQNAPS